MPRTMTIERHLCDDMKRRKKWTSTLCHFCRHRKRCPDNPDKKTQPTGIKQSIVLGI